MPITRRTYPGFRLTNTTEITVVRDSSGDGSYVDGKWVDALPASITMEANVQPMQFKELLVLPESERTKEWIKIYSVSELRTANEAPDGWNADKVIWEGRVFRVMKCRRYVMGVLDHFHAIAAMEPVSAKELLKDVPEI